MHRNLRNQKETVFSCQFWIYCPVAKIYILALIDNPATNIIVPARVRTCFFCFVLFFKAGLAAYGSFQARGPVRAAVASLHDSHSNVGTEPRLWPTPQLTAMPDPWPAERGQGSNWHPHGYWSGLLPRTTTGTPVCTCFIISLWKDPEVK